MHYHVNVIFHVKSLERTSTIMNRCRPTVGLLLHLFSLVFTTTQQDEHFLEGIYVVLSWSTVWDLLYNCDAVLRSLLILAAIT